MFIMESNKKSNFSNSAKAGKKSVRCCPKCSRNMADLGEIYQLRQVLTKTYRSFGEKNQKIVNFCESTLELRKSAIIL